MGQGYKEKASRTRYFTSLWFYAHYLKCEWKPWLENNNTFINSDILNYFQKEVKAIPHTYLHRLNGVEKLTYDTE